MKERRGIGRAFSCGGAGSYLPQRGPGIVAAFYPTAPGRGKADGKTIAPGRQFP
jgi:hypothetical protein